MARIRIGVSGWAYPGWSGTFYPEKLPARDRLVYASRGFDAIEINASFYRLQRPESWLRWKRETPPGFRFAVKGSRFITHNRKLAGAKTALANFFASGVLGLAEKLGPVLWQLPDTMRFEEKRVAAFLDLLPRDIDEGIELGRGHDCRLDGRGRLTTEDGRHRIRHAVEPRHESYFTDAFARLCRRHGVAIVVSESADWPCTEEVTAGFIYVRLHGSRRTYASRYGDGELDRWAARVRAWSRGEQPADAVTFTRRKPPPRRSRDVFVFFDNDANANAPGDAERLISRLRTGAP